MATAWFIVPYKRDTRPTSPNPARYPAIDDYTGIIEAAGGQWAETEVLGNRCLVKVRAPAGLLQALAGEYKRLPKDRLDDSLADLPTNIKQALRNELLDMGYTAAEILARFGDDLGNYTLHNVLRFMATRRLTPRWDPQTNTIHVDGPAQACRPVHDVNAEVAE